MGATKDAQAGVPAPHNQSGISNEPAKPKTPATGKDAQSQIYRPLRFYASFCTNDSSPSAPKGKIDLQSLCWSAPERSAERFAARAASTPASAESSPSAPKLPRVQRTGTATRTATQGILPRPHARQ